MLKINTIAKYSDRHGKVIVWLDKCRQEHPEIMKPDGTLITGGNNIPVTLKKAYDYLHWRGRMDNKADVFKIYNDRYELQNRRHIVRIRNHQEKHATCLARHMALTNPDLILTRNDEIHGYVR
jgi:hypothetical protein